MRSILSLAFSLFAVLAMAACQAAPASDVRASATPAVAAEPVRDGADPPARQSSNASHVTVMNTSVAPPWSVCDPGIGVCVGPNPTPVPERVCEPANGTCLDMQPADTAPTAVVLAQAPVIREAFNLLFDHFVEPLETGPVLQRMLDVTRAEVVRRGGQPPALGTPAFSGDRMTDWQTFAERYQTLASAIPDAAAGDLVDTAIRAMAEYVKDGHTTFLSVRDYEQYRSWLNGNMQYVGIGVRLAGSPPTIYEVFRNSPAEHAGLQFGDQILGTEGRPTVGVPLDQVVNWIRGRPGTLVRLTVSRPGGVAGDLVVPREQVEVVSTEARMLGNGVGYIHMRGFPDPRATDQVVQALEDFRSQSATGLILDLRGNSGGRIDVGLDTLSLFMDDRPAYVQLMHDGPLLLRTAPKRAQLSAGLALAVLVDGATASMGEVFAAAIQDNKAGRLIGTVSAGNVAAGEIFPLSDGSALQVTVFRLETALGRQMNRVGVRPDAQVDRSPGDVRDGRDPQLEAALTYLGGVSSPLLSTAP